MTDFTAKAGKPVELPDITDLLRSPGIMGMSTPASEGGAP